MWKIGIAGAIVAGFVAGCTEIVEVPLSEDHPASASAAQAPRPAVSTTLRIDDQGAPQAKAAPDAAAAHGEHVHGQAAATTPATQAAAYACPMHPEVAQATPGICPKCRMKLEPKKAAPGAGSAQGGHEGHP